MMQKTLKCFWSAALLAVAVTCPLRAEEPQSETFESLNVGLRSYTNVTILNRSKSDLFIRHAGGMANIKVRDLDKSTQLQLGYMLADATPTNASALTFRRNSLPRVEFDSRYEEMAEKIIWESQEYLARVDASFYSVAGGRVFVLSLSFCWCCHLICRKAGLEGVGLVWFPLLKQVPLLRAARMSPWWLLANLLPPVFLISYIIWSFKIAKARGKSAFTGFLLLLPGLNVLAFLYLAFSDLLSNPDDGQGKMVTFQQRRTAA